MKRSLSAMFSKDDLEILNSVLWFSMDACWMFQIGPIAYALVVPVLLSGLGVVLLEKQKDVRYIDLAMLAWMVMNAGWLISDMLQGFDSLLAVSKASFVLGVVFIFLSLRVTRDWRKTMKHFRRVRISRAG